MANSMGPASLSRLQVGQAKVRYRNTYQTRHTCASMMLSWNSTIYPCYEY